MKKVFNILSILASIVSCLVIIFTFLTSYQFFYVGDMFSSYLGIQISVGITMGIWAVRFWLTEHGNKKIIYTLFCSISMIVLVFFIANYIR